MGMTKRWCNICKFNQYDPHPCKESASIVPDDDILAMLSAAKPPRPKRPPELMFLVFNSGDINGGSIPAGARVTLVVQPQCKFLPKRLVVPPEIGSSFALGDLRIGNWTKFASYAGSGVSMSVFPPDPDPEKGFPINNLEGMSAVQIGQCLMMSVTNRTLAALQFSALVYGESLDSSEG